MRFHLDRLPRLALPLAVALLVTRVLINELELSRLWAVPAGLWCAVQVQYRMNARTEAAAKEAAAKAAAAAPSKAR